MMTDAEKKVRNARTVMLTKEPFFAVIAMRLKLRESEEIETTSTDGQTLFFNPTYINASTPAEIRTTIAHLAMHLANQHHLRMDQRDADTWNKACDIVVNEQLASAGYKLGRDEIRDDSMVRKSVEAVYAELQARDQQNDQQGGGDQQPQGQQGQQDGGNQDQQNDQQGDKPGRGDVTPYKGPDAQQEKADLENTVKQAVAVGKKQGNVPGDFAEMIDKAVNVVDWKDMLRDFITRSHIQRYDWNKPSRRFQGSGVFLPGRVSDAIGHVVVAIDTSGSIDTATLSQFMGEIQSMLDENVVANLTVVMCDAKVHDVSEFAAGEIIDITVKGGGGTKFSPVMEMLDELEPDVCVYFTDLLCDDFGDAPDCEVVWAQWFHQNYRAYQMRQAPPPFGVICEIS